MIASCFFEHCLFDATGPPSDPFLLSVAIKLLNIRIIIIRVSKVVDWYSEPYTFAL